MQAQIPSMTYLLVPKKTSNGLEKTSFPVVWLCCLPPYHLISKLQLISGTLVFRTLFAVGMTALA
jgi:hypothetical protein